MGASKPASHSAASAPRIVRWIARNGNSQRLLELTSCLLHWARIQLSCLLLCPCAKSLGGAKLRELHRDFYAVALICRLAWAASVLVRNVSSANVCTPTHAHTLLGMSNSLGTTLQSPILVSWLWQQQSVRVKDLIQLRSLVKQPCRNLKGRPRLILWNFVQRFLQSCEGEAWVYFEFLCLFLLYRVTFLFTKAISCAAVSNELAVSHQLTPCSCSNVISLFSRIASET